MTSYGSTYRYLLNTGHKHCGEGIRVKSPTCVDKDIDATDGSHTKYIVPSLFDMCTCLQIKAL